MISKKRKAAARSILVLYVFITATFPLSHKDFVPLSGRLSLTSDRALSRVSDISDENFMCPAHNFAQSTTAIGVVAQNFPLLEELDLPRTEEPSQPFFEPSESFSTRAPPQA